MRARDAIKLHVGDEIVDKESGESIRVLSSFEDKVGSKKIVMIEGVGSKQGYNHWQSSRVK